MDKSTNIKIASIQAFNYILPTAFIAINPHALQIALSIIWIGVTLCNSVVSLNNYNKLLELHKAKYKVLFKFYRELVNKIKEM